MSDIIKKSNDFGDMLYAMSEGNHELMNVLLSLMNHKIQNIPAGMMYLLELDNCKIQGNDIWVLYKDICDKNIDLVCLVLRAFQYGTFSKQEIAEVIKENSTGRGTRKLVSEDIMVGKDIYDITTDAIYDNDKFKEYLKKQREFFESQQSTFGG